MSEEADTVPWNRSIVDAGYRCTLEDHHEYVRHSPPYGYREKDLADKPEAWHGKHAIVQGNESHLIEAIRQGVEDLRKPEELQPMCQCAIDSKGILLD